jgi:ParB/RepB/Spo0J family partition protein
MHAFGALSGSDLVPVDLILEPEHPVRSTMDDTAMEELIESMMAVGLIQPVILTRKGDHFEVVCGHRRLYAARALQWAKIPAVIFNHRGIALEAARIHENEMREAVNAGDEAVYLRELVERYQLDEAGLSALVRRSPAWIAARWGLLQGDESVLQSVREGKIRLSVAQELNRIADEKYRHMYLAHAERSGYSAAIVAQWRRDWEMQGQPTVPHAPIPPQTELKQAEAAGLHVAACFLCGGYLDPWNLEVVHIHKHERAEIMRHMAQVQPFDQGAPSPEQEPEP